MTTQSVRHGKGGAAITAAPPFGIFADRNHLPLTDRACYIIKPRHHKTTRLSFRGSQMQDLLIEVFLDRSTTFGQHVEDCFREYRGVLMSHKVEVDPSGYGSWEMYIPGTVVDGPHQWATVALDGKGLRLTCNDFELVPTLPDTGIDMVAITYSIPQAIVKLKCAASGWIKGDDPLRRGPAHAWRITPTETSWVAEVRARASNGPQSLTAARKVFDQVANGKTPSTSGGISHEWRLDPWPELGLGLLKAGH